MTLEPLTLEELDELLVLTLAAPPASLIARAVHELREHRHLHDPDAPCPCRATAAPVRVEACARAGCRTCRNLRQASKPFVFGANVARHGMMMADGMARLNAHDGTVGQPFGMRLEHGDVTDKQLRARPLVERMHLWNHKTRTLELHEFEAGGEHPGANPHGGYVGDARGPWRGEVFRLEEDDPPPPTGWVDAAGHLFDRMVLDVAKSAGRGARFINGAWYPAEWISDHDAGDEDPAAAPELHGTRRVVCARCRDTHTMPATGWACTACPIPCPNCAGGGGGGNGAFCAHTPCKCDCHKGKPYGQLRAAPADAPNHG